MNCREFVEFLMSYLDDELQGESREVFERHLEACPPCMTYLRTYEQTVELGRCACQDPTGPVPDEVPRALIDAILEARKAAE